jgi:hypothetical protein
MRNEKGKCTKGMKVNEYRRGAKKKKRKYTDPFESN